MEFRVILRLLSARTVVNLEAFYYGNKPLNCLRERDALI